MADIRKKYDIDNSFTKNKPLSETTLKRYISHQLLLERDYDITFSDYIDSDKVLSILNKKNVSDSFLKLSINAIMFYFKQNNIIDPITIEKYRKINWSLSKKYHDFIDKNENNEYQELNQISWEDVLSVRNKIENRSNTYNKLIIGLYTYIPPRRLDYIYMYIASPDFKMDDENKNFYYKKDGIGYFIINKYKQHEQYKKSIKITLPDQLTKIIENYISDYKLLPKDKLLKINSPPNLSIKITQLFKEYFDSNKNISVDMLRHSFASYIKNQSGVTIEQQKKISLLMGHSIKMNAQYAKINKNNKSNITENIDVSVISLI